MKQNRNLSALKRILEYCSRIRETAQFFGDDYDKFKDNNIYKDAVALCILQIGELSGVLTDEFKERYNEMPWKQIKALRDIVTHRYGTVDSSLIWDIIKGDVPELEEYCKKILDQNETVGESLRCV